MWTICYMGNLLHCIAIGKDIPLEIKQTKKLITWKYYYLRLNLIDPTDKHYGDMYTWGRVLSSLKKLKTLCGDSGSQMVVAALRTTPLGCPGSVLLWMVTRTPTSFIPEIVVHRWPLDALMLAQKLLTILWASFIMLLLPSGDGITDCGERN